MKSGVLIGSLMLACIAASSALGADADPVLAPPPKPAFLAIPYKPSVARRGGAAVQPVLQLPTSTFTFRSGKDGNIYTNTIVGPNPFQTQKPPRPGVRVYVVPLTITLENFSKTSQLVLSAARPHSCGTNKALHTDIGDFMASPIFSRVAFDGNQAPLINGVSMGYTNYANAFRRAEFYNAPFYRANPAYQIPFEVVALPEQTIGVDVTRGYGYAGRLGNNDCIMHGILEFDHFNDYITNALLPAMHADPRAFYMFLVHNLSFGRTDGAGNLIPFAGAYHSATDRPAGAAIQTYAVADYESQEGSGWPPGFEAFSASHEVLEWLDDPLANNATPSWGEMGYAFSGCSAILEVADPVSDGNIAPILVKGVPYKLASGAFWSWFYAANHDPVQSFGVGGKYSVDHFAWDSSGHYSIRVLTGPSKPCPPGGTYEAEPSRPSPQSLSTAAAPVRVQ